MGRAHEVRAASMAKTAAIKSKLYSRYGKELYIAAKSGVPILTITDSDTSPAAAHSTLLLLCPTSTKLFYNSMTVPMAMLNILASCLVIDSVSPAERQIFIDTLPS